MQADAGWRRPVAARNARMMAGLACGIHKKLHAAAAMGCIYFRLAAGIEKSGASHDFRKRLEKASCKGLQFQVALEGEALSISAKLTIPLWLTSTSLKSSSRSASS